MPRNRATHSYEWNVLCDVCGFKKKASEVKKRWDGYMVCAEDWEIRHPMDFFTNKNDVHVLPFIRSDNNGTDVGPPLNPNTRYSPFYNTGIVGLSKTGLAIVGRDK